MSARNAAHFLRVLQHANLLGQCAHIRDLHIWLRLCWGGGTKTWLGVASIDPDSGQAERLGRSDVVVEALGDMQDFLRRHADACKGRMKIVQGGLVGLRLLRGDDPVELHV